MKAEFIAAPSSPRRRTKAYKTSSNEEAVLARARKQADEFDSEFYGRMYMHAVEQQLKHSNSSFINFFTELERPPVDIHEFMDSEEFFVACGVNVWPEVRRAAIKVNENWWRGTANGAIEEVLFKGATGTGKSEIAKISIAYHTHILHCMRSPQEFYGLPKATEIVFTLQSAKPSVTKHILYAPLRSYIEQMPWFMRHARLNRHVEATMHFSDKNVHIAPIGGDQDAIIGAAVIGCFVDEVNFYNVVQQSRRAIETTGRSGTYDQAMSLHRTITRRKKSRFLMRGPYIGPMMFGSSTRYKGDFTDRREKELKTFKGKSHFIYNKSQYEARPATEFSGEKFYVAVMNDAASDIRIFDDREEIPQRINNVLEVPIEYRNDFMEDAPGALRDVAGLSVRSINPFFKNRAKVDIAISTGVQEGAQSILTRDDVLLAVDGLPVVKPDAHCKNPAKPRYVHIDLSKSQNACGVAMIRCDGMATVKRVNGTEVLPYGTVEFACSIQPDSGTEIDIGEIRQWVLSLKFVYGYPIRAITYDTYQSQESVQVLKKKGMPTGIIKIDRSSIYYKSLRDGINDGRLKLYVNETLEDELKDLEYHEDKDKIDHPPHGSKDTADAVCGAYWTMLNRATTWSGQEDDRPEGEERFDDGMRM